MGHGAPAPGGARTDIKSAPRAPSAERRAPSAERRAPSAERRAPSAERRAPSAERRAPSILPPGLTMPRLTLTPRRNTSTPAHASPARAARALLPALAVLLAAATLLAPPTARAALLIGNLNIGTATRRIHQLWQITLLSGTHRHCPGVHDREPRRRLHPRVGRAVLPQWDISATDIGRPDGDPALGQRLQPRHDRRDVHQPGEHRRGGHAPAI